jgi:AMP nucleosidase
MTRQEDIPAILDALEEGYAASVARLRAALTAYTESAVRPDPKARDDGAFAYPELRIEYDPEMPVPAPARAFARLNQPGIYTTSVARPALFRSYLAEQLEHLVRDYPVRVSVGASASEIPYPFVLDGGELDLRGISTPSCRAGSRRPTWSRLATRLPTGRGTWRSTRPARWPLFDAPRTDFSLARLKHYTGTPSEHFQRFILFTNYVAMSMSSSALRSMRCAIRRGASPACRARRRL